MAYIPIITHVVVIEREGDAPKVVAFPSENQAQDFRDQFEQGTDGVWDDDPNWHNYARHPIKLSTAEEAFEAMWVERDKEKEAGNG